MSKHEEAPPPPGEAVLLAPRSTDEHHCDRDRTSHQSCLERLWQPHTVQGQCRESLHCSDFPRRGVLVAPVAAGPHVSADYRNLGMGFWIVERKEDGRFFRQCGLIPQEVDGRPEMEVAYLFARKFWGQGYATEAARACRDRGFEHLDLARLVSLISVYNTPSIRIAERNGMTRSGKLTKGNIPHHIYAISREEWLRRDA